MKGIHLIAFLASWTVITASKLPFITFEECPAGNPCPPVLIAHETDCSKFYECQSGRKVLRSCAAGLYFSKKWQGCVNREISDCPPVTPSTTTTTSTPPWTPPPGECVNGELIKHECKCEKFYECKNGAKALRECPDGEIFNPTTKTCQPGDKDTCEFPKPPGCTVGTNKPHECQCKKYYTCIPGDLWALRECDDGWHFDNTTLKCIVGADCNPKQPICYNGDREKHECRCDKYYECDNEDWIVKNCANGLHFSEALKICTDPLTADCDDTLKPDICPVPTPDKWPHECDCRLYYQCVNNKKKLYECSWGSYYDRISLKCNAAKDVKDCRNKWDDRWLPK